MLDPMFQVKMMLQELQLCMQEIKNIFLARSNVVMCCNKREKKKKQKFVRSVLKIMNFCRAPIFCLHGMCNDHLWNVFNLYVAPHHDPVSFLCLRYTKLRVLEEQRKRNNLNTLEGYFVRSKIFF